MDKKEYKRYVDKIIEKINKNIMNLEYVHFVGESVAFFLPKGNITYAIGGIGYGLCVFHIDGEGVSVTFNQKEKLKEIHKKICNTYENVSKEKKVFELLKKAAEE